jgi:hypothetical protein
LHKKATSVQFHATASQIHPQRQTVMSQSPKKMKHLLGAIYFPKLLPTFISPVIAPRGR